ncbi:SDR family NAD(P)-dependent oxidoreductase [Parasphingopyxis algicola]|uniref:SDR family NAD(P)-dependent oxidoreductase n=1 Tax=Parasphingopyxis algicola TaxID=2026624 RepID=UPI0015A22C83|nr:SDR family NAD(P)-dependent oxidoreductase [Parasphingopyxis algicola]QLC26434.1 SDR family NAD(P)-dependent oxidoreductase [Parasphingopyxis algicola]
MTNSNQNLASTAQDGGPENPDRRSLLAAAAVGAAAAAGPAVLGATSASAQSSDSAGDRRELSGKVAFITGGARGIGLASAEELAKAGADIVLFDIATPNVPHVQYPLSSEADLQSAKTSVEALGARCLGIKGDVRDRAALDSAMQQAVDNFGSLDIVVVNAGVSQAGAIRDFSADEVSTVYEINVAGAIKTTQAAARIMVPQNSGRMIFISSALGRMGNELFPVYASTKWAMIGFAKSAAVTYGKSNILCNVVAPGLVDTPLANNSVILGKMMPDAANPSFDAMVEGAVAGSTLNVAHLEPIDVAKAVLFFAGDSTSKVAGEVFDVSYGSLSRTIA